MPYMTFVNSMSLEGRPEGNDEWVTEELQLPCPNVHCERYMAHMHGHHDAINSIGAHRVGIKMIVLLG